MKVADNGDEALLAAAREVDLGGMEAASRARGKYKEPEVTLRTYSKLSKGREEAKGRPRSTSGILPLKGGEPHEGG